MHYFRSESEPFLLLFLSIFCLILFGCATSPNVPFSGPYPDSLNLLSQKNPLLSQEIGKLPEIQDGISHDEERALDDFLELYLQNAKHFDLAFDQMYQVGKPEVRKYCSPLQALYWLFLDDKKGWAKHVIDNYNGNYEPEIIVHQSKYQIDSNHYKYSELSFLLDAAWASFKNDFTLEWFWRLEEAKKVEASCIEKSVYEKIKKFRQDNVGPTDYALMIAEEKPEAFTYKFNPSKFDQFKEKQIDRWSDFSTVIDRLNAPELVDKYQKLNFIYDLHFRKTATAKSMFKEKIGNCYAHVKFAVHALEKAGYPALGLGVRSIIPGQGLAGGPSPGTTTGYYHLTTAYKARDHNGNKKWFILDNAWKSRAKGIHGPFGSISKIRKWYK